MTAGALPRPSHNWFCCILCIEILDLEQHSPGSKRLILERFDLHLELTLRSCKSEDMARWDTERGSVICFLRDPKEALMAILNFRTAYISRESSKPGEYAPRIRAGLHVGNIREIEGENGTRQAQGASLLETWQILNLAAANEITASPAYYDLLGEHVRGYQRLFISEYDLGTQGPTVYRIHFTPADEAEPAAPEEIAEPNEPTAWQPEALTKLTAILAEFVGPLAWLLVKKASGKNQNWDDLLKDLAERIDNAEDRASFYTHCGSTSLPAAAESTADVSAPNASSASESPAVDFTPELLAKIESALAAYIGPLAKILVQKKAAVATSLPELGELLGEKISDKAERKKFLTKVLKLA